MKLFNKRIAYQQTESTLSIMTKYYFIQFIFFFCCFFSIYQTKIHTLKIMQQWNKRKRKKKIKTDINTKFLGTCFQLQPTN